MAQINFYNLRQESEGDRALFACRLTEKALSLGHRVCLFAGSEARAREVDSLLWSFSPTSFIPHDILLGDRPSAERVCIAAETLPKGCGDVVINLSSDALAEFDHIARVNEIIIQEPSALEQARARFRHYQQAGTRPEMIKL
ncbi:MAG: DNA polymerase III subunit chi [Gammaproteobacteria bacterium]|jgi:DNA polymerase-3 subunit chi|nr:DNA polymerase III subunit chi [Gammaproteobacteria bacterium]